MLTSLCLARARPPFFWFSLCTRELFFLFPYQSLTMLPPRTALCTQYLDKIYNLFPRPSRIWQSNYMLGRRPSQDRHKLPL